MGSKWTLEVEVHPEQPGSYVIRLGIKRPGTEQLIDVIAPCGAIEDFQQEVVQLVDSLNQLAQQARRKITELNVENEVESQMAPDEAWKEMESLATENEVITFFNAFEEPDRKAIAEYVFSHVNMFKGRGPFFSEHYDSVSYLLE